MSKLTCVKWFTFVVLTLSVQGFVEADDPPRRDKRLPTSPEVAEDRQVTFRVRAPKADEVLLKGFAPIETTPMTRDDEGVWSVTIGPLEPEIYSYWFEVDGARQLDESSRYVKPSRTPKVNLLEVPGGEDSLTRFNPDIAHGTLHRHEYLSDVTDSVRNLIVYTPPTYRDTGEGKYPVLYLFHGTGDHEGGWTVEGRAHRIMDNLLHGGRAIPMIIVMPDVHVVYKDAKDYRRRIADEFEQELLTEIIPFVEKKYRAEQRPEDRAIAGLSLGSMQALRIGLKHPQKFAWIGGFSGPVVWENQQALVDEFVAKTPDLNEQLKLIWVAVGEDDWLIKRVQKTHEAFKAAGIEHEYQVTPGRHEWPVWRRYLVELLPRLFHEPNPAAR
ncbi:esterase [Stratiformator vulcanicus]|uniref:Carbohydrate acetyl esterase/feruloyl esterase n=1 Tax=Stratiformator vulcanicus TaxID=2527980 RepID=A0A517QYV7_9PLAN|nr:esterase [Stratiformator vulcanicus]QDT36837.1 Carbohydrate acetyl esterase/feruloyl esterase precursor [Stratiformator vulcanicus]